MKWTQFSGSYSELDPIQVSPYLKQFLIKIHCEPKSEKVQFRQNLVFDYRTKKSTFFTIFLEKAVIKAKKTGHIKPYQSSMFGLACSMFGLKI